MGSGNGATPESKLEVAQSERPVRCFTAEDAEWYAWPSGASAYGTGTCGPASLEAIHFARSEAPDMPMYEALLPAGRFYGLYDEELVAVLQRATRIVAPAERPLKPATRRGEGLL